MDQLDSVATTYSVSRSLFCTCVAIRTLTAHHRNYVAARRRVFIQLFGYFRRDNLATVNQAITFVLFVGPLLASGIALVNVETEATE